MSSDPRFSAMHSAPIFAKQKKDNFKTKVDSRFSSLLTDEKFVGAAGKTDIYGRKNKKNSSNAKKEMESLYVKEDSNDKGKQSKFKGKEAKTASKKQNGNKGDTRVDYLNKLARGEIEGSSSENSEEEEFEGGSSDENSDSDDEIYDRKQKSALAIPSITKEGKLDLGLTGEESDEEPQYDTSSTIESNRIAIQNCDWDNISAKDIMAILLSFCPTGKRVDSVSVYYSDFGLQRMKEEEEVGPQGIWLEDKATSSDEDIDSDEDVEEDDDEDIADISRKPGQIGIVWEDEKKHRRRNMNNLKHHSDSDLSENEEQDSDEDEDAEQSVYDESQEGSGEDTDFANGKFPKQEPLNMKKKKVVSDYNEVAVRKYELSKLKYCFAVVTCDSAATAAYLYEQLDGIEFHNSSMEFDLSLVPDEVDFSTRKLKDECKDFSSNVYEPPADFVVNALQHTSVECTWDKGESHREKKLTQISQWRKLQDSDFAQYIASDSDSDDEGEDSLTKKEREAKAKGFRKALLGGGDSDEEHDDFFQVEENSEDGEEDVHKTFSFVPKEDEKETQKSKKKEKRKLKAEEDKKTELEKHSEEEEAKSKALLELMLTGESDDVSAEQYNMHEIRKAEMKRLKKEEKK